MVEFQSAWGWQPALYLFLGGLAGGAFIVAAVAKFLGKERFRATVAKGMWFALICLVLGLLVLITDVSQPLRAMLLWNSFSNANSWMAIGAWLLFLAVIVFAVAAVTSTDAIVVKLVGQNDEGDARKNDRGAQIRSISKVFSVFGIFVGLCVVAYTGVLLSAAPGIAFWQTWLLPVLFTVSALDTGVAAMIIIAVTDKSSEQNEGLRGLLEKVTFGLVAIELVVLAVFLFGATGDAASASAAALTEGWLSMPFWLLVVVIGLAVPLVVSICSVLMRKKHLGSGVALAGSCCALIGGCALRFVVVYAGAHYDTAMAYLTMMY